MGSNKGCSERKLQIAISRIAGKEVGHLASPPSAHVASYRSKDADDGIGNRGTALLSLIARHKGLPRFAAKPFRFGIPISLL
jgi:hypothetical protein